MSVNTFKVLLAGTKWRMLGSDSAGQTLLEAMDTGDEQQRMLAGMSLVKAGGKSVELIKRAIDARQANPALVRLLADFDQQEARAILRQVAENNTGELKAAAEQSLALLQRIDSHK